MEQKAFADVKGSLIEAPYFILLFYSFIIPYLAPFIFLVVEVYRITEVNS